MKIMDCEIKNWDTIKRLIKEFKNKPSKIIWCELNKIYSNLIKTVNNNYGLNNEQIKYLKIFLLGVNIRHAYHVYNIEEHEEYINELNKLVTDNKCKKYLKYAISSPN